MSNFRSLLSSFQDATGTSNNSSRNINSNRKDQNHRSPDAAAGASTNAASTEAFNQTTKTDHPYSSNENETALKEDIERLWRTSQIQSSFNTTSSSSSDTKGTKSPIHVAVCATIVSDFPHEEIWKSWMRNHPAHVSASIHIHAKTPNAIRNGTDNYSNRNRMRNRSCSSNEWLKSKLIPISHNPNWNDYRIILAMLSLAKYAIEREPTTTHFIMITESCIPIATLKELSDIVYNEEKEGKQKTGTQLFDCSFLDLYGIHSRRCTRFDEHKCFSIDTIPKDAIYKALPGWAFFSRKHMEEIIHVKDRLNGRELYPLFKSVWAPEEVYFATALVLLGKLNDENNISGIVRRSLMWSEWDTYAKGEDRAHPIEYDGQFCKELIDNVKKQGFIFMRKWKRKIDVRDWERVVIGGNIDGVKDYNLKHEMKRKRGFHKNISCDQKKRQKYSYLDDTGR